MALLKSAWEIALERTEGIEADSEKIRKELIITEGRKLAGTYLSELEDNSSQLEAAFLKAEGEERELLTLGLATTVLLNLSLPQSLEYEERMKRIERIVEIFENEESEAVALIGQVSQLMGKYLQARDSLLERAQQQYAPIYEEKRERMMQQYGRAPNTPLTQDPEFIQLLQRNFNQLSSQYQHSLDEVKESLKERWGIE